MLGLATPVERNSFCYALLISGYHVRPSFQPVQIIRPNLHHLAPLRQVLGKIISRAHGVALRVGKLPLDLFGSLFRLHGRGKIMHPQILRIVRFDIFRKSRVLRVSNVLPVNIAVAAMMLSGTLTR